LTAPFIRRTWAPQGKTPIFYQKGRSYQKVSAIGALCVSPNLRKCRLFFRLHCNQSVDKHLTVQFLSQLRSQIKGPIIIVWDRLQVHRSKTVRSYLKRHPNFHFEFFPPYAPELNPVEYVWGWLKMNPLANKAFEDAAEIAKHTLRHGRGLQYNKKLLRSFLKQSPLFFCLK